MELQKAFRVWSSLLGQSQVFSSEAAQEKYGRCTTGITRKLAGALIPVERSHIPAIVKTAAHFKAPLYPISTGHNWGYGTALPPVENCIILDLSKLCGIIDFDADTGSLTIEPGVTQGQLAKFLDQGNHPYLVPVTGAGPTCSILGNALERGYGITPYTDHFAAVMTIEAVLSDGSIYSSALSGLGGKQLDRAFKWGVGPYLDGIFSQSSLGVVTQMTIVLERRPESIKAFLFGLKQPEQLGDLVLRIQEVIARYPGIVGGINLMNAHRILAMTTSYPKSQVSAGEVIPAALLTELCNKNQIMPWTGLGTLYGSIGVVNVAQREIKLLLKPLVSRLLFMSPKRARTLARIEKKLPAFFRSSKLGRNIETLERSLQLVDGRPNETALPLCYWLNGIHSKSSINFNPANDGCGLIWYAPLVPMKPDSIVNYVKMVTAIMRKHKLEPLITLTSLSDRCFDSTVPLLFDMNSEKSRKNAENCYWALLNKGRDHGYIPYRVGIHTMAWLSENNSTYWQIVRKIKKTLDPHAIISPGRYV